MHPVRIITLIVAVLLVLFAISDHPFLGGQPGFGGSQMAIAAIGVGFGLFALAPIAANAGALTLVVTLLVAFLGAEIVARSMLSHRFFPPYNFNETRHFELVPGASGEFIHRPDNGGNRISYQINSDGFRGAELETAGQARRVVVYGDSFIQAAFSSLEHTFTERLETHLAERLQEPVEVVNAGIAAYGPDQMISKMTEELPRLKPDLVVISVFAGNDFGDIVRNKLYRLDDAGNLTPSEYILSDDLRNHMRLNHRESILKRMTKKLRDNIRPPTPEPVPSPTEFVELCLATNQQEFQEFIVEGNTEVKQVYMDLYNADMTLEPESESSIYKKRLMEQVLSRLTDIAKTANVPVAMMFIPHPMDVAGTHSCCEVDTAKYPRYDPAAANKALVASAEKLQVPFLDLFDDFRNNDPMALYLQGGDDHWNNRGQDFAARLMTNAIIESGLLKRP